MTVKEFCNLVDYSNRKMVLKDAYNGREYTQISKYSDREIKSCFARLDFTKDISNIAFPVLVVWIKHNFRGDTK